MLIESPRWTSSRMGPTFVIVAEKPLPPNTEVSSGINEDIVPMCSTIEVSIMRGINLFQ